MRTRNIINEESEKKKERATENWTNNHPKMFFSHLANEFDKLVYDAEP
jgi:hypothetical protein